MKAYKVRQFRIDNLVDRAAPTGTEESGCDGRLSLG